jgi:hypothetical protein
MLLPLATATDFSFLDLVKSFIIFRPSSLKKGGFNLASSRDEETKPKKYSHRTKRNAYSAQGQEMSLERTPAFLPWGELKPLIEQEDRDRRKGGNEKEDPSAPELWGRTVITVVNKA